MLSEAFIRSRWRVDFFIALRLFTVFLTLDWIIKALNEGSGELFTSTNCRDGVFPCFLLKRRYLWRPYETPRKKAFAGQRVSYYNKEWFTYNYLGINSTKTQAMVLGNSSYNFEFFVDPQQVIDIKPILKILGVTLDNKLSFKDHVTITLKKAYAKIAALRRIKRLIPSSIMISLYKTYVTSFRILFPSIVGNLYSSEK